MKTILITIIFSFSLANGFGQTEHTKLTITHLTGDFYVYITYNSFKGKPVPANAMYMVTDSGVVMFDTPWDSTQFQPLLDSIMFRHHKKVVMSISTHFHEDRTIGLEFLKQQGVKTYSTKQTDDMSKTRGEKRAVYLMYKDTAFTVGEHRFQTYYGGPGHAPDNIVIWFGKEKILYGGCLVKSTDATDLGNLGDANLEAWPATIKNIQRKFGKPNFVIPGHESWTNKNSPEHTLKLLRLHK